MWLRQHTRQYKVKMSKLGMTMWTVLWCPARICVFSCTISLAKRWHKTSQYHRPVWQSETGTISNFFKSKSKNYFWISFWLKYLFYCGVQHILCLHLHSIIFLLASIFLPHFRTFCSLLQILLKKWLLTKNRLKLYPLTLSACLCLITKV